jgi:hypothetical protein
MFVRQDTLLPGRDRLVGFFPLRNANDCVTELAIGRGRGEQTCRLFHLWATLISADSLDPPPSHLTHLFVYRGSPAVRGLASRTTLRRTV